MGGTAGQTSSSAPSPSQGSQSQPHAQPHVQQYQQHPASPAPLHPHQYAQQSSSTYTLNHNTHSSSHHSSHNEHHSTPQGRYPHSQASQRPGVVSGAGINPPRLVEVYHLSDSANASIPEDIREQFQRDEHGHVLFFTAPPLDVLPPTQPGSAIGHTARYLAEKIRRKKALEEKRKADGLPIHEEEPMKKKPKHGVADASLTTQIGEMRDKALRLLIAQMDQSTVAIYKDIYGDNWEEGMKHEQAKLAADQQQHKLKQLELEEGARTRKEKETVSLTGNGVYLDDFNPRY